MPYRLRHRENKWCVMKVVREEPLQLEAIPGGCHEKMEDAQAHLAAMDAAMRQRGEGMMKTP